MKYQEAVTDIMKNPTKIFTSGSTGRAYTIGADELGFLYVIIDHRIVISEEIFIANVHARDLDWQEVKQPVTWQEAIQAGSKGRMVRVEFEDGYKKQLDLFNRNTFSFGDINNGTWYIED